MAQITTSQAVDPLPPFTLTPEQRARIDAETYGGQAVLLQGFHQQHCWDHRQVVGVWGSLDAAHFTRSWDAHEPENMAEAFAVYLGIEWEQAA